MAADYRISVYLGAGEDGKRMYDKVKDMGNRPEFMNSQMEFIRHCIRFTLAHDPQLKKVHD